MTINNPHIIVMCIGLVWALVVALRRPAPTPPSDALRLKVKDYSGRGPWMCHRCGVVYEGKYGLCPPCDEVEGRAERKGVAS